MTPVHKALVKGRLLKLHLMLGTVHDIIDSDFIPTNASDISPGGVFR